MRRLTPHEPRPFAPGPIGRPRWLESLASLAALDGSPTAPCPTAIFVDPESARAQEPGQPDDLIGVAASLLVDRRACSQPHRVRWPQRHIRRRSSVGMTLIERARKAADVPTCAPDVGAGATIAARRDAVQVFDGAPRALPLHGPPRSRAGRHSGTWPLPRGLPWRLLGLLAASSLLAVADGAGAAAFYSKTSTSAPSPAPRLPSPTPSVPPPQHAASPFRSPRNHAVAPPWRSPSAETVQPPSLARALGRRRLQTSVTVHDAAELTAAVVDVSVDHILLAPGTYELTVGVQCGPITSLSALCIDRDVTLEALEPGAAVLDAQASSEDPRRVMAIVSGTVMLIGLAITGGFQRVCSTRSLPGTFLVRPRSRKLP